MNLHVPLCLQYSILTCSKLAIQALAMAKGDRVCIDNFKQSEFKLQIYISFQ